ncbi:BTB/POZ protein [Nemania sp. NC0429]|nr:BTB/POZ protein [Nemania sp. NC0429]
MANFTSIGPRLLESGEFSDFILVCGDEKFSVHKNIVCAQSPVIAAAMEGQFMEAETNIFQVNDFKPVTLECMVQYMYTGKYEEKPLCRRNDEQNEEPNMESDSDHSADRSISERWIHHGLVNCIADFFHLPALAKMSIATLDEITQEEWSAGAFRDLLCETLGKTGDKDFHHLLATRAADHIGPHTEMGLFNGSDLSVAPAVLRICAQRLDESRAELADARSNGRLTAFEGITSFFKTPSGKSCKMCHTLVSCSIEGPMNAGEGLYRIRCTGCGGVLKRIS